MSSRFGSFLTRGGPWCGWQPLAASDSAKATSSDLLSTALYTAAAGPAVLIGRDL